MSAEKLATSSTATNTSTTARKRGRPPHPAAPSRAAASLEAKRRAAVILEVLAGSRRPSEAAAALGVTVPRYYLLEEQALRGLVAACEPRINNGPRPETRLAQLEKQLRARERECARQQALVRAAQRTVGLAALPVKPAAGGKPAPNAAKNGKSRRHRRPTVRALKAARALSVNSSGSDAGVGLQPSSTGPGEESGNRQEV